MNIRRSDSLPARLRDLRDAKSIKEHENLKNYQQPESTVIDFADAKDRDEVIATWKSLQSDVSKIQNGFPSKSGGKAARDSGVTNGFIQRALIANNDAKKRATYDNRMAGGAREADRSSSFPLDVVQDGGRRQSERSASASARRRTLLERLLSWRTKDCDCKEPKKREKIKCTCTCSQNGNTSKGGQFSERGRSKSVGYVPTKTVAQFRRCNSAAASVGDAAALRQRAALTLARRYYPEGGWGWTVTAVGAVVHVITHGLQLGGGSGPIARNAAVIFMVPPLHTYVRLTMDKSKLVFKEYTKRSLDKSSVWNTFLRTEDGSHAQCKLCKRILQCSNTTTCLHNHIKKQHPSADPKRNTEETSKKKQTPNTTSAATTTPTTSTNEAVQEQGQSKPKKARIDDYYQNTKENCMETVIFKMTACDGIPFNTVCKSESIRMLFKKSGYDILPKSPNTIKKIVVEKTDELKNELRKELAVLKAKGQKFSVSLDEWTSARNRRYINVNLHCPNFHGKNFRNLGLARIIGRGTSEMCLNILQIKLASYDLSLENDIAGVVTDGASVMTAMGRQMPSFHQLCIAHGIQCAVVDVIYKNLHSQSQSEEISERSEEIDTEEIGTEYIEADNDSEVEETEENHEEQGFVVDRNTVARGEPSINVEYKDLIDKVRKVVKFFKKSPTRTEVLNKYVAEENKNSGLVLDCKTRWNSMADMVSRFLLLKDAILKALIDLKDKTMFNSYELALLQDLSTSLTIVKTTVEVICQERANLITAETALQFMVSKLREANGFISGRLLQALKLRIAQRRKTDLVCTLKYLHNPNKYYQEPSSTIFPKIDNDAITKVIVDIQKKFYNQRPAMTTNIVASDDEQDMALMDLQRCQNEEADRISNMSIKEQLQKKIDDEICAVPSTSTAICADDLEMETSINMQMALYDAGAPRQVHLNQAYDVLMSIPPTSVDCERVFSSTKYICNHLRCKLNDDSMDALSFLRSHSQRILNKNI